MDFQAIAANLGRSGREIVLEDDLALNKRESDYYCKLVGKRSCLVKPSLPGGSLLARDTVLPKHEVHGAICILHWPGWQLPLN